MWKPSSVHRKPDAFIVWLLIIAFIVGVIAACSSAEGQPTSVPTRVLIPPTATFTPLPITPSATLEQRPAVGDLAVLTPSPQATSLSQVEQRLIELALEDLTGRLEISPDAIQLAYTERTQWRSNRLDCLLRATPTTDLQISGYRIVFLVGETVYQYHTDDAQVRLCDESDLLEADTEILLRIDVVAAELVTLAQRRLAQELDLPLVSIQVIEVRPVRWEDTSLGCPVEGQAYAPVITDGYRIVIQAGDNQYIFHTSFDGIVLCENEPEIP